MAKFVKEYNSLDTDRTLSADSDYRVSSQKAIKGYVDDTLSTLRGAIDWKTQDYTVTSKGKVLTINLSQACIIENGMFAFYQGKTLIPQSMLSFNAAKTVLTITSDDDFLVDDVIHLRWAYYQTDTLLSSYLELPSGVTSADTDLVVDYGTTNNIEWRIYKSGRLEQRGVQTGTGTYGTTTISLPKTFSDTNYTVIANKQLSYNSDWYTSTTDLTSPASITDIAGIPCDKSTSSFKLQSFSTHTWIAIGTISSS